MALADKRRKALRKCTGTTKRGTKCKAPPIKGTSKCLSHSSEEVRGSVGFVASAGKLGGRPRMPRATELQRMIVEAAAEEFMKPYLEALGLHLQWQDVEEEEGATRRVPLIVRVGSGLVVHGESKEGRIVVSKHKDLRGQIDVVEKMLDRVFGKPKQTQEIAGSGGGPVRIEVPRSAERAADVARILAGAGALPSAPPHEGRRRPAAPVPAKASSNGENGHR